MILLFSIADETLEVRDEISSLWQAAGQQYYMENQNELQNLNLIDKTPENYPDFIVRPTLGCRALVRRSLQVLNIILHEMEDWKEDVRLHSTKLLMQVVIHSEDHLATKYFDINAVLCKTCADQEAEVAKTALEVAKLVGHFVAPSTWSKYIFEELKVRQEKLGVIKCMNAIYKHSTSDQKFDNLLELTEILVDSTISHRSH
jgi:dynein assembly factor 5, axonemal